MSEEKIAPGGSPLNENGLTARQQEILDMHDAGMSQKQIADKLGISKQAVYIVKTRLKELGKWE